MNNTFARRFTGVAATTVIILVMITVSWRAFLNHLASDLNDKVTKQICNHLKANAFTYDKLQVTSAVAGGGYSTVGSDHTVYYRVTNLRHPSLGSTSKAVVSAVLIDYADGEYTLQDFSICQPAHMKVDGWYY